MLYPVVLALLVIAPPIVAGTIVGVRGLRAPASAFPFLWAAVPGLLLAGGLQVASVDVEGMAVLAYGYAILASLAGALVCGLIGLGLWLAGGRRDRGGDTRSAQRTASSR